MSIINTTKGMKPTHNTITKRCVVCSKLFKVYPSRKDRKYCSNKCNIIGKKGKPSLRRLKRKNFKCKNCNKTIEGRITDNILFCSRKCYYVWKKGLTKETNEGVAKMAASRKLQWKDKEYIKKQIKSRITNGMNKMETKVFDILENLFPNQYKFVGDGELIIGTYNPDFINCNGQKKLIEFYGDYWHRDDNPQDRIDYFKQYGYKTIVIWGREIRDEIENVNNRLREFHNV